MEIQHTKDGDKEIKPGSAPHSAQNTEIKEYGQLQFTAQFKRWCLDHDDHQCKDQEVDPQQELDELVLWPMDNGVQWTTE